MTMQNTLTFKCFDDKRAGLIVSYDKKTKKYIKELR
jgi:hypothetical protein